MEEGLHNATKVVGDPSLNRGANQDRKVMAVGTMARKGTPEKTAGQERIKDKMRNPSMQQ